ncbi:MAG: ABC transporter permease [Spirochaetaceae bacterium]|jgi:peptide/nickel transport system permease protein|nr:ABC transporter permease [Spirochaetaceae bacterium]
MDKIDSTDKLTLDDARRVRVLSPGALVLRRFFANKLSIVGLCILIFIFLFSFVGGLLMPYTESQVFMTEELTVKDSVYVAQNTNIQVFLPEGQSITVIQRGQLVAAINRGSDSVQVEGVTYTISKLQDTVWLVSPPTQPPPQGGRSDKAIIASRLVYSPLEAGFAIDYNTILAFEEARSLGLSQYDRPEGSYTITEDDGSYYMQDTVDGSEKFVASPLSMQPVNNDVIVTSALRKAIEEALNTKAASFSLNGTEYTITKDADMWTIKSRQSAQLVSMFEKPSAKHWLGTDGNGMDVITRLMYGGRISLLFALAVIVIDMLIGTVMGGLSGYFGGWVDMLVMRIVDIWFCIPTLPLYIIIGAVMDGLNVAPQSRITALVLLLGFMNWAGTARLVRGQILSLREQEFMVAAKALGIRTSKQIFRHLIPNVVPQLIVISTMGVGGVILSEAVLSFLGLGIKFPMASWGTILNMANDVYVMTNFPYVWIPAGMGILLTVLGFNFVGDGLRDAFDPRTRR